MIIRDGIQRMYANREDIFYYITLYNENYPMPRDAGRRGRGDPQGAVQVPAGARAKADQRTVRSVHLLGSGSILREALRAQEILAERYGVAADVWSVTSYKELRRDALEAERWNLLHPDQEPRKPYVAGLLEGDDDPIVAVTDYMKLVPEQIARWLPGRLYLARHRRLRPQRDPRGAPPLLRGGRRVRRPRRPPSARPSGGGSTALSSAARSRSWASIPRSWTR